MKPAKAALLRYCLGLYIQRRSCVCSQFGLDDSCLAENEFSFGWAFESRMKILVNTRIQVLVVALAASSALFAQGSGTSPGQPQNQQGMLDARQILALAVAVTERSWPAYVLLATPHPGYHAHGKFGKMFSKVEGQLWIDKQDYGWIKVDGEVTQSFSMGLFVAHMQRGAHIILEQTCVGESVWVPKRLQLRFSAKILLLKSLNIDRILTYSDYRPEADSPSSVCR